MRCTRLLGLAALVSAPSFGDQRDDLSAALARWQAAAIINYSFVYESRDDNIVPRTCFPYAVRTTVRNGTPKISVVVQGRGRCPAGSELPKAERDSMPRTIEKLFASVDRALAWGSEIARVEVRYDAKYGYPVHFSAEKIGITDNDEGFEISKFSVGR